jgi:hypothetical protein
MSKNLTRAQLTGRLGEVKAELTILDELGFLFHPTSKLEAGTDGFIEICDLATREPLGRYVAVQIKSTDKDNPDFKASPDDVEYWRKQNLPFILLRVMRKSGNVLWKIVDKDTASGTIRFSVDRDKLDQAAAAKIASLVDDRYLKDSAEFQNRLAQMALDDANDAFTKTDYQLAVTHCRRAERLASCNALRARALYHRIDSEINQLLASSNDARSDADRWLSEIHATGLVDELLAWRVVLEARIALLGRDYSRFQKSISEGRKSVFGDAPQMVEFTRLALEACRPSFFGRGRQQLKEEELLLGPIMDTVQAFDRVLLLGTQIHVRADLKMSIEQLIADLNAATSEYFDQDGEPFRVILELLSLAESLARYNEQHAAVGIARTALKVSEKVGTVRQQADAAEVLAQVLTMTHDGSGKPTPASMTQYAEAQEVRQRAEERICYEGGGGLTELSDEMFQIFLPLVANRIKSSVEMLQREPSVNNSIKWSQLEQDCTAVVSVLKNKGSRLHGDTPGKMSILLCLQGEIAAEQGRYSVAAETFHYAHSVGSASNKLVDKQRFQAASGAGYFLAVCGKYAKAARALDEAERFAKTISQRQQLERYREMTEEFRQTADWVTGSDSLAITAEARIVGVRAAIRPTVDRLLALWDNNGGANTSVYDYWGRGGFQRIAAAIRGATDDVIAVDATTLYGIEEAARLLCPLFETVLVKWKGSLVDQLAVMTLREGGSPYADWLCGSGFAATPVGREGTFTVIGQVTSVPSEVAEWLGTQGRPLLASGRLVVVPAAQVGCTQTDVGWTDDVFLSRFLQGVVVATGGKDCGEGQFLDLAQVALPYMGGPGLNIAGLAAAIEDLGEGIRPFRRRIFRILGAQECSPLNWAQKKSMRMEIEDGIEEVRQHFERTLKNTSVTLRGSHATVDVVQRASYGGRAWMSEALHEMAGLPTTLREWLPLWRFKELGGRFNWAAPLTGSEHMFRGLRTSWLSPPNRGTGRLAASR